MGKILQNPKEETLNNFYACNEDCFNLKLDKYSFITWLTSYIKNQYHEQLIQYWQPLISNFVNNIFRLLQLDIKYICLYLF